MTEKRYFSVDYDEKYYIFDSTKISKEEVLEKAEYSYDVFGDSLMENEVLDLLNENEKLKKENKHLRCTIESNSQDDYIDFLEKQNERLKERIEELASNDKIVFMVNG